MPTDNTNPGMKEVFCACSGKKVWHNWGRKLFSFGGYRCTKCAGTKPK